MPAGSFKFFYYFPGRWPPLNEQLVTGTVYRQLAVAAEEAGFYGACIDEHPAPVSSWLKGPGGHHCLDPFVTLAAISAVTTRLKLLTYLTVVPYRNPFLFAKTAVSLDVMSDGRLILGVGTGYMKGEADALGVDFSRRNELFTEAMDIFRESCRGEPITRACDGFSADEVVMLPKPVQRPYPPIWLGGTTMAARRRAVDYGHGWMPTPRPRNHAYHRTPPLENIDDFVKLMREMTQYAKTVGRQTPLDIVISSAMIDDKAPMSEQVDAIRRFRELGVTGMTINGEGNTPAEARSFIGRYGSEVIDALDR